MIGVGHPNGGQLTGSIEAGEHGGIAAVRLQPIAGLPRNQRRRHHVAPMAKPRELAMNAIAARASLIAKRQWLAGPPETIAQLADGSSVIGNLAEIFHRAGVRRGEVLLQTFSLRVVWQVTSDIFLGGL
ncbi:hypothetical protein MesoLjLa_66510 (plasmid) [Mesorhizobium sp. L-2-11]|nr:hypothetical protein MesoLjLa_66510 [Mesorhizobium sp. L-2-11]